MVSLRTLFVKHRVVRVVRIDSTTETQMLAKEARKQMCLWSASASDAIQPCSNIQTGLLCSHDQLTLPFASVGSQTCGLFMLKDRQHNSSIKVQQTDTLTPVIPSCGVYDAT